MVSDISCAFSFKFWLPAFFNALKALIGIRFSKRVFLVAPCIFFLVDDAFSFMIEVGYVLCYHCLVISVFVCLHYSVS